MPCMELRSTFIPCFFFLFLILALPYFPRGRSQVLDSEVYEIDYRGPETHSPVPSPHDHSHAKNSLPATNPPTHHKEEKVTKIRG